MRKPGKSISDFEPKKGQRRLLSGDKVGNRCPFLGFNPNSPLVTKEMSLDYLASILAELYLYKEENERK